MKIRLSSFLQLKFNVLLYQKLGWRICLNYLLFLGGLYYFFNRKERERISESLSQVFEDQKNEKEIKILKKEVFKGILYHYYEKIYNAYENIESLEKFYKKSINQYDFKMLDVALEKGKGVIFVTGHYGAIEYIPIFLALNQYPISVVVKFATKQLENNLYMKTKDLGLRIINAGESKNIFKEISKELKQNRIVFFECDEIEEWRPSKKENMWFLGKMIGVDKTIDLIHRRTGAEIIFGLLHRASLNNYELILQDYKNMISCFNNVDCSAGEMILKYFEQYIYSYPQGWYQWKNYPDIHNINNSRKVIPRPVPSRVLKPALGPI